MNFFKSFFLAYLILEIIAVVYVGKHFGIFMMFSEMIISAFVGGLIILNTQANVLDTLRGFSQSRANPMDFVRGNFAKAFGGLLLIFPGVFCDIFGIIILINAYFILKSEQASQQASQDRKFDEEIIDIEILEKDEKKS